MIPRSARYYAFWLPIALAVLVLEAGWRWALLGELRRNRELERMR